ncbi:[FeFe] hydrogenase H-cluster radical SAM maturase HydE [Proteiniclasticum sp. QWL-01]|uniref:[FeFe] hydrogenase H-cluster radical SAM maturase HydE n=1 Tax=Proteiniclasticum sp. QWL-01 TaxID=3036945 RepID=UPI0021FBDEFA|nr:[FeFe] hydrogenase H-cluster radical SAM maturase HydE [Proteiniclasticum sp. QWL-01]UUM11433.1 [FeFe] hydrogenase H-cluster radical SAM maturase HydE [Clostridiaceae bacterium HFYG-1003]WFF72844.1 [FeFe] hydrogenase H-cluster radical SAM maturase HydE [Proteiniclasticum sp. QWL-01]
MHTKINRCIELIDRLDESHTLTGEEIQYLLEHVEETSRDYLTQKADATRRRIYGDRVFLRGLVEVSNFCIRHCQYCGINGLNPNIRRYRLSQEEILASCRGGYEMGFRTFVLQGGEDPAFTDEVLTELIRTLRRDFPDAAVTLSLGERSRESYRRLREAGADRYLLRHETRNRDLYQKIHPNSDFDERTQCLRDLKELGYQVGAGFMVGIPGQTRADLAQDLLFVKELDAEMVGIGPFMPHHDTIFKAEPAGSLADTLLLLSLTRLLLPQALIPATTALASVADDGRELGLKAGCNVIMPNLSPPGVRASYSLYDGKVSFGSEAAEGKTLLEQKIKDAGYQTDLSRGDHATWKIK